MLITLTLTQAQVEALGYALDLAHGDQAEYLTNGSPATDYGAEWPATAAWKAEQFQLIATVAENLGLHGERERWEQLAKEVQE